MANLIRTPLPSPNDLAKSPYFSIRRGTPIPRFGEGPLSLNSVRDRLALEGNSAPFIPLSETYGLGTFGEVISDIPLHNGRTVHGLAAAEMEPHLMQLLQSAHAIVDGSALF